MLTGVATSTGNIIFKNTHRIVRKEDGPTSQFQRQNSTIDPAAIDFYGFYEAIPNVAGRDYTQISKAPTPRITLRTMMNNDVVRQTNICFLSDAIDGVDRADARSPNFEDNLAFDSYFALGNSEYVQSTTNFDINKKFPLGFKNNQQTTFKIKVTEIVNFFGANNVYLHDKVNDLYYDIKNQSYEFSLPAGVNNTRFEITFTQGALSIENSTIIGFDVFQNNTNAVLTIKNPKLIDIDSFRLFDVTGKLIFNKVNLGTNSQYDFNTESLSEGVYIANIDTKDGQKVSKKVIISKLK